MKIILYIFALCFTSLSYSQNCMTYQEMGTHGFNMAKLDSAYTNATHPDSIKGPFTNRQEEFSAAWLAFNTKLMKYLSENNFEWESPTWCHMKVYFKADGSIDYWFYNFRKSDKIPSSTQIEFENLLKEFLKTNHIAITSHMNFSQCSGITFVNL